MKATRRPTRNFTNSLRDLVGSVESDGGTALDQFEKMSTPSQDANVPPVNAVAGEQGTEPIVGVEGSREVTDVPAPPAWAEGAGGHVRLGGQQVMRVSSPSTRMNLAERRSPAKMAGPVIANPEHLRPMDLATTHTGSEHKLYTFFYEETVLKGIRDRQFTHREMSDRTGIRSSSSIKDALRGLVAKQSVEVLWVEAGNTSGSMYRVYTPSEVEARRRAAAVTVDLRNKKVVSIS
jgi:hypothetical protein